MADGTIGLWTVPLGVLAAGVTGALLGALHAGICSLPRVNDIAVGIALMLFGTGLAFYLGKPLIEPTAARLPAIDFGWWSDIPQVRAALRINVLFLIGVAIAPILFWAFRTTRWGLLIRTGAKVRMPRARWAIPCCGSGCAPPWSAVSSPVSAARSCRCFILEAGTRASPAAKASRR